MSNPDVEVGSGSIGALCDVSIAITVLALLSLSSCRPTASASRAPETCRPLSEHCWVRSRRRGRRSGFWWSSAPETEQQVGHGAEACYLVRRVAITDIGPQDERYVLDWEGIDWSARAATRGWEIWWTPDAIVNHYGGAAIRQVPFSWILRSHRGMYRYFATRSRPAARVPIALLVATRCTLKLGAQALIGSLYDHSRRRAANATAQT